MVRGEGGTRDSIQPVRRTPIKGSVLYRKNGLTVSTSSRTRRRWFRLVKLQAAMLRIGCQCCVQIA
jgi:hypothetical protein